MRRWMIAAIGVAFMIVGGIWYMRSGSEAASGPVTFDQLPETVMQSVQKELPKVKFVKAWRLKNGNYQVQGRDAKGKVREVELDSQGKIEHID